MFTGSSWTLQATIDRPELLPDDFKKNISIADGYMLIGAPQAHIQDVLIRAAYLYKDNGSQWILTQTMYDPAGVNDAEFGCAVDLKHNQFIIGSLFGADGKGSVSFGSIC